MTWLRPGCVGMTASGPQGQPRPCYDEPTWCALTLLGEGTAQLEAHQVFACDEHADGPQLIAPRQLLERDREVLAERRAAAAWWRLPVGQRTGPPASGRTRPLAVGAEARRLARRAEQWAARQRRSGAEPAADDPR